MITIPALSSVTDILDSDLVMITHSNGESYKIAGSEINKRNQVIIASGTTITGAPLKTGNVVRVFFTADVAGANTSTALVLTYNSVNYTVKVPRHGSLANFVASDLGGSPTVYKYLQAYTTLELLYDGTNFVIMGNPIVISGLNRCIYADGTDEKKYYDFSYYASNEETIFIIEMKLQVNANSTSVGNILINGRFGSTYMLNYYNFSNTETDNQTIANVVRFKNTRNDSIVKELRWDITQDEKVRFYLKKGTGNSRYTFKILQKYWYSSDEKITFSTTTDVNVWNNAAYSKAFTTFEEAS